MIEVITLWRHTRMVVLVALTAALYAALLIPFKPIAIIPGITEIRPANVIPIVCSILFGPAAAWGSAFGNLIGDFFGTLGPGSFFGFFGNFLYGYLPYKIWGRVLPMLSRPEPRMTHPRQFIEYAGAALAASAACGLVIGWGLDLIGIVPFAIAANVILLNNFVLSLVLGPPLLAALYPRVARWGLLHTDILEPRDRSAGRLSLLAVVILWVALIWGMVAGNTASVRAGARFLGVRKASKQWLEYMGRDARHINEALAEYRSHYRHDVGPKAGVNTLVRERLLKPDDLRDLAGNRYRVTLYGGRCSLDSAGQDEKWGTGDDIRGVGAAGAPVVARAAAPAIILLWLASLFL